MTHIRLRASIKLNGDHTLTEANLQDMKPMIERVIAQNLGPGINVDTVKVTRINEAKPTVIDPFSIGQLTTDAE